MITQILKLEKNKKEKNIDFFLIFLSKHYYYLIVFNEKSQNKYHERNEFILFKTKEDYMKRDRIFSDFNYK